MNLEDQNPLQSQLEKELQESEWLQKFKCISEALSQLKAQIPLTQLCELKWLTDDDSLVIYCPNLEIREELEQQLYKFQELKVGVTRFIIKFSASEDIIIEINSIDN